jgi:PAS domain S-box-containing protein
VETCDGLCPGLLRAINACGDPVFLVDERWTIVHWNPTAESAFGRAAADVLGKPCYDVVAGVNGGGRRVCQPRCEKWGLARRGARVHNFNIQAFPGQKTWLNVSVLPITDAAGRVVALAHLVRNINQAKRLERFVHDFAATACEVLAPHAGNGTLAEPTPVHLTARELEVLRLLAHGADTDAIAERLGISRHTAHNHIAAVLNKLGAHSRVEAAAYAFEHHLV